MFPAKDRSLTLLQTSAIDTALRNCSYTMLWEEGGERFSKSSRKCSDCLRIFDGAGNALREGPRVADPEPDCRGGLLCSASRRRRWHERGRLDEARGSHARWLLR